MAVSETLGTGYARRGRLGWHFRTRVRLPPPPPAGIPRAGCEARSFCERPQIGGSRRAGECRWFSRPDANCLAAGRRKRGGGPAPGTVGDLETERPLGARLLGRLGSTPAASTSSRFALSRRALPPSALRSAVAGLADPPLKAYLQFWFPGQMFLAVRLFSGSLAHRCYFFGDDSRRNAAGSRPFERPARGAASDEIMNPKRNCGL